MIQTLLSIGLASLFLLIAAGVGKRIIEFLGLKAEPQEVAIFATVVGIGSMGTLFFFLGIFHLYYKSILALFFILGGIFFYKEILWVTQRIKEIITEIIKIKQNKVLQACTIILLIFMIGNFFFALTPEVQWDSLVYHMTTPKLYARAHGIVEIPYDFHTYLTKQIDIQYVVGEIFGLEQYAKVLMYSFNLFLSLGIYVFCKQKWNMKVGLIAMTILYTIPIMTIYEPTTYNDISMGLFLFYACTAFLKIKQQKNWIFLCGFLIGSAAGTKIFALGTLGFFIFMYVWFFGIRKMQNSIADIVIIGLVCFLVIAPWLTITTIQTKNPIYPFFYNVFGGENWTPELAEFWSNLFTSQGGEKTITSFFLTPWNLTMHSMLYGPVYGYSPVFLIFIPLFFLLGLHKNKNEKVGLFFFYFIIYYIIMWFLLAADGRYILSVFPAATIITTITMVHLWEKRSQCYRYLIPGILILVLLSNLGMFIIMNRNTVQVLVGVQEKEEYIQNNLQNYRLVQWINENLDENAKIFVANDDRTYFLEKEYLGGYPIIQGYIDYVQIDSAEALYTRLKKEQITHVMITYHETSQGIITTPFAYKYNEKIILLWAELTGNYGKLVKEKNNVFLYELR